MSLEKKPSNAAKLQISSPPARRPASTKKQFFKTLLKNNPFDPVSDFSRKVMKSLGVLDIWDEFIYWNVGRANFIKLFTKYWGYDITGKENFPEYGGALVIANHQSELDPFLVGSAVHRKVRWLSKAENFEVPIFRSVIKPFGTIPLRRGKSDEEALAKVRAVLEGGECVGMFPEGTRSPDGRLAEFRSGGARLCLETGVPYVPCAIFGAYKIMPKGVNATKINLKGGLKVSITVGKPVYMDPELEPTYENAQIVKEAMFNDIVLLKAGKMNESRVIRSRADIANVENLAHLSELMSEGQAETLITERIKSLSIS